jgi:hypothetical protein
MTTVETVFVNELTQGLIDDVGGGKSNKGHLVRFIKKNFREGTDFITKHIDQTTRTHGGNNRIVYMMTDDTMELIRSSYNLKHRYVKKVKDTAIKSIVMSIENSTIGFICNALGPLFTTMIRQHRVWKYHVDLYIPHIDLCIECDEHGHCAYNMEDESKRQAHIEKELACTFLRFNPNSKDFDLSDVISDILKIYNTRCAHN